MYEKQAATSPFIERGACHHKLIRMSCIVKLVRYFCIFQLVQPFTGTDITEKTIFFFFLKSFPLGTKPLFDNSENVI